MIRLLPVLILLALAGVLILQWKDWPPSPAGVEPTAATPPNVASGVPDRTPELMSRLQSVDDKGAYGSLIERPLFRPDRRPEPEEESADADPESQEPNAELETMDLTAVLITPTLASAWVKDPSQPKLRRLRIGDDFEGWLVREILEDRVRLERQGEEDELILRDYTKMPARTVPKPIPRRPSRAPERAPIPRR